MSTAALRSAATGKSENPIVAFSSFLDRFKPQISLALPKHLNADRMARLALSAFSQSEKLQACDPKTIVASIMAAGTMGLEINVAGQGFLVPYKTTCTFVPGWMGLVDLVNRSGNATVYTGVIFSDQKYVFRDGSSRSLEVLNETALEDAKDITHVYAVGWVRGASMPVIELWKIEKVRKHRDRYNKVGSKHYSFRDWEMYARKVPLLQVLKYMPKSIELQTAIDASNATEVGMPYTIDQDFGTVTTAEDDGDAAENTVPSFAELQDRISKAPSREVLEAIGEDVMLLSSEVDQKRLVDAITARLGELEKGTDKPSVAG